MNVLAFDTALDTCSAALWSDGKVAAQESVAAARGHAEILFPMLDRVLESAELAYADVDRFGVTIGPGSFTGVRVGVAAARGLALGLGKPAIGITTLEAIAATAFHIDMATESACEQVMAAIDARRGEIYFQIFRTVERRDDLVAFGEPMAMTPDEAARAIGSTATLLAGSGAALVKAQLEGRGDVLCAAPLAADPGILAALVARRPAIADAPPPSPLYLRAPDAKLPASGRRVGT